MTPSTLGLEAFTALSRHPKRPWKFGTSRRSPGLVCSFLSSSRCKVVFFLNNAVSLEENRKKSSHKRFRTRFSERYGVCSSKLDISLVAEPFETAIHEVWGEENAESRIIIMLSNQALQTSSMVHLVHFFGAIALTLIAFWNIRDRCVWRKSKFKTHEVRFYTGANILSVMVFELAVFVTSKCHSLLVSYNLHPLLSDLLTTSSLLFSQLTPRYLIVWESDPFDLSRRLYRRYLAVLAHNHGLQ
jgi:hypothetical protein